MHAIVLEMERCRERLLIIGHQGVLRILYAYWKGYAREEATNLSVPLNTIIKLTPGIYGCTEERTQLCVDEIVEQGSAATNDHRSSGMGMTGAGITATYHFEAVGGTPNLVADPNDLGML